MSSGSFSSSLALLGALTGAPALGAQSTHLAELERSAPAITVEPSSALATGGWESAWLVPAAGDRATGILVGIEHNGFAALTSLMGTARVRLGPTWQVSVAQVAVKDLFDAALLELYPGLAALGAAATQFGADAVVGADRLRVSLGWRYERDELLGDATSLWLGRASLAARLPFGFRAAASAERAVGTGGVEAGAGRFTVGLARPVPGRRLAFTWGAGAIFDDTWALGRGRRLASSSLRVSIYDLISFAVAGGAERDPFAADGWLGFLAFGLGVNVGVWSADFRHGGPGDGQAAPTAVSVLWAPDR